jgi:hypothetical protein
MEKSFFKKFKEMYEGLFNSSSLNEYKLRLSEITEIIKRCVAEEGEYYPLKLLLIKPDFF